MLFFLVMLQTCCLRLRIPTQVRCHPWYVVMCPARYPVPLASVMMFVSVRCSYVAWDALVCSCGHVRPHLVFALDHCRACPKARRSPFLLVFELLRAIYLHAQTSAHQRLSWPGVPLWGLLNPHPSPMAHLQGPW